MSSLLASDGAAVVRDVIDAVHQNRQYLSDIDGEIGDGDHGINMNKGFTLCGDELDKNAYDLSDSLLCLSKTLMTKIGGAMGPLYGTLFRSMGKTAAEKNTVDAALFAEMLTAGVAGIRKISKADVGDKTLMDVLVPAERAYRNALSEGKSFSAALDEMSAAARSGRDSTKELVSKIGRSSRLGERSKGVIDAGAASSCLILETMADSIKKRLE
jgi:dihydroxyacetone kinase-like protein